MKLLVCGGRTYSDKARLNDELDAYLGDVHEICHGAAAGADSLAGAWALSRGIPCRTYPADWQRYGKRAGPLRNADMLARFQPDRVVAFTGGAGTAHMVRIAEEANVRVDRFGVYVFVFGSNLAGRHGRGAALEARNCWGAIYGQGEGRQGASYGIPTKDEALKTRPLADITRSVEKFIDHAYQNPTDHFNVTRVGCGLAGYQDKDIAPLFHDLPKNVVLPREWQSYVG